MTQRIVVVGGGFAGLWGAVSAARTRALFGLEEGIAVTLVAPGRAHIVRVRCYEADLAPLRVPFDDVLAPVGIDHVEGVATGIDVAGRRIVLRPGSGEAVTLAYDRLVLAPGSVLCRPDVPGIDAAFDVDTLAGAQRLADHLAALGSGARGRGEAGRWTAVVIGGGLVGIEIACELPARLAAARDRAGDAGPTRTILIDREPRIGAAMGAAEPAIRQALAAAEIVTVTGVGVAAIDGAGVTLADGTRLPALTVLCATGLRASPLAETIGAPLDALGRLPVDPFLRVAGMPEIYAAGDVAAAAADADGHETVMSCQHARPMGRFAGHNAVCDLAGRPGDRLAFQAPDYVTVLDLGAWGAAYTAGWDREHLVSAGGPAKTIKRTINGSRIYPPLDRDPAAILAAAAPVIQDRPAGVTAP